MRELKLRYVISLLSDIGKRTSDDAKAMSEAQARIKKELGETETKVGRLERALMRMGGVGTASAERQVQYLAGLAKTFLRVATAADKAAEATGRMHARVLGGAAAAAAADHMAKAPMEYSARLAHLANTAFTERDAAGRIQGKQMLDAAIRVAVKTGGGNRDDALAALDKLIASGTVSREQSVMSLPVITKTATASNSSAEGIAQIAVRMLQSGVGLDRLDAMLNKAMVAGQEGGFELSSMPKWLPQAIAAAGSVGMKGEAGVTRLLAHLQAGMRTAGTADEAGNNLVNLLGKITSVDTAKDFAKFGIDLPGAIAKAAGRGETALDAFIPLVERVVTSDPRYRKLAAQVLKEGPQGGETANIEAMRAVFQGAGVGKVVQDRQALMALVAELEGRDTVRKVMEAMRGRTTERDTAFSVVSSEASFKREGAVNAVAEAAQRVFDKISPALGTVFDTATDLAQKFPVLTSMVVAAAGAVGIFTAALAASGLVGLMGGGAAAAKAGWLAAGAKLALGSAARLAGPAAAGAVAGYEMWQLGDALKQLYDAKTREGVKLTPEAAARIRAMPPDWLAMTAPKPQAGGGQDGLRKPDVTIGDGRLQVDVRVADDRTTAQATVTQQPRSLVRVDAGATKPGGPW